MSEKPKGPENIDVPEVSFAPTVVVALLLLLVLAAIAFF